MEDGRVQAAMGAIGLTFTGSDSNANALGVNKFSTKQIAIRAGIPVIEGIKFTPTGAPSANSIVNELE
jgi:D-alanine-D-alanine ligase-like ATP-grasp enzyme